MHPPARYSRLRGKINRDSLNGPFLEVNGQPGESKAVTPD